MILFIAVVVIVLMLGVLVAIFFPKPKKPQYEYRKKLSLMTPAEKRCFDALTQSVGKDYHVFPQIHLATLLDHKVNGQSWQGAFRHIDEKSVDFVLCDKGDITPVLAIELDDWSHDRPDRQERDGEVERIFKAADMPLLRLKGRDSFDLAELAQDISKALVA